MYLNRFHLYTLTVLSSVLDAGRLLWGQLCCCEGQSIFSTAWCNFHILYRSSKHFLNWMNLKISNNILLGPILRSQLALCEFALSSCPLKAAEREDVHQSDICASFISLPASPGLLRALQLDRSFHTAHPAFLFSAFCESSRALCSNLSPLFTKHSEKRPVPRRGDICWEVAWIHVIDGVIFYSQRVEPNNNNSN